MLNIQIVCIVCAKNCEACVLLREWVKERGVDDVDKMNLIRYVCNVQIKEQNEEEPEGKTRLWFLQAIVIFGR